MLSGKACECLLKNAPLHLELGTEFPLHLATMHIGGLKIRWTGSVWYAGPMHCAEAA